MSTSKQLTTATGAAAAVNPLGAGVDLRNQVPTRGGTLVLRNNDATNQIAIGASGVTAGTGYRLLPGAVLVIPEITRIDLYAIAVAGTPVLDILLT